MEKTIKIILAFLLLLCLTKMPYAYFQMVRFLGMLGFAFLAFCEKDNENKILFFVWIVAALLINPITKISLGRELWNIVDIILAILLIGSLFLITKNKQE
ncbi:MAG: hypothetical protein EAZ85_02765 [Bacteroidetes bacterium]|nr:MAG: hypothetical protein EAZ85_02765 [Bacteroidota bacterium]